MGDYEAVSLRHPHGRFEATLFIKPQFLDNKKLLETANVIGTFVEEEYLSRVSNFSLSRSAIADINGEAFKFKGTHYLHKGALYAPSTKPYTGPGTTNSAYGVVNGQVRKIMLDRPLALPTGWCLANKAREECENIDRMRSRGISSIGLMEAVGYAVVHDQFFFMTTPDNEEVGFSYVGFSVLKIPDVADQRLDDMLLYRPSDIPPSFFNSLGRGVREMHDAGAYHRYLHSGNVGVVKGAPYLYDLDSVVFDHQFNGKREGRALLGSYDLAWLAYDIMMAHGYGEWDEEEKAYMKEIEPLREMFSGYFLREEEPAARNALKELKEEQTLLEQKMIKRPRYHARSILFAIGQCVL